MLKDSDVEYIKTIISERRRLLESTLEILVEIESSLKEQESALERYENAQSHLRESNAVQTLLQLINPNQKESATAIDIGRSPKTNVQIFEDILIKHGRPMHAVDIAAEAIRQGVVFQGKGKRERQTRNSLVTSKRFQNQGGNVWWVVSKPLNVEEPSAANNGHSTRGHSQGDTMLTFGDTNVEVFTS